MSSKESIISAIRKLNQEAEPLPKSPSFESKGKLREQFIQSIETNKGTVSSFEDLISILKKKEYKKVFTTESSLSTYCNTTLPEHPSGFADLDLAILKGQFAVAENGAIWLEDIDLKLRAIPFITAHLVILLEKNCLVSNMHEAYEKIGSSKSSFGLFLAGPSKTADIEQSLVIGAHGAMSLNVVLLDEDSNINKTKN